MNRDDIVNKVIKNCHIFYDREHPKLVQLGRRAKTEGEIRYAAGDFVEKFLQHIFNTLNSLLKTNIISKVGSSDFLHLEITYKGKKYRNDKIQVDRHVYNNDKCICFIENKTYLDSCYYDRALADFKKIIYSINYNNDKPEKYKYIVFAGQNAANLNTLNFYEAEFYNSIKHLTYKNKGVDIRIFFFLKGKRNSQKPLYKIKHELDDNTLKDFIKMILDMLEIK